MPPPTEGRARGASGHRRLAGLSLLTLFAWAAPAPSAVAVADQAAPLSVRVTTAAGDRVERARRAGVIIHTIAPDEEVTATRSRIDGYDPFLADVAVQTGGLFLLPRADTAGAVRQIVRDSSHVYRLVLDAGGLPLDLDAIGVTVRGDGRVVRTTLAPRGR